MLCGAILFSVNKVVAIHRDRCFDPKANRKGVEKSNSSPADRQPEKNLFARGFLYALVVAFIDLPGNAVNDYRL
jgi:hypothetical protein